MLKILAPAALIIAATSAASIAADWVYVGANNEGDVYQIDRGSIRTMPNGFKRAWVMGNYPKPSRTGNTAERTLQEYDCSERRFRVIQWAWFKGNTVKDLDNTPGDWSYVAPDTIAESFLEFVCFGNLDG